MKLTFIDINSTDGKTYTVNPFQIVRMYDGIDYSVIELSNGEEIKVKLRVIEIKGEINEA